MGKRPVGTDYQLSPESSKQNAFCWYGSPSIFREFWVLKSGKTHSQTASETREKSEAAGIDYSHIEGLGKKLVIKDSLHIYKKQKPGARHQEPKK